MKLRDLSNTKVGRLTVVKRAENDKTGRARWLCRCDCGTERVIASNRLVSSQTKSCGCYHRERAVEANTKHGKSRTKEFNTWAHIKQRCSNPKNKSFGDYGERGIKICQRWEDSFDLFFEDMGIAPMNTTIERINNFGDYEPKNCRWATRLDQGNNKRNNIIVYVSGIKTTLSKYCREHRMSYMKIYKRLKRGLKFEEAIS